MRASVKPSGNAVLAAYDRHNGSRGHVRHPLPGTCRHSISRGLQRFVTGIRTVRGTSEIIQTGSKSMCPCKREEGNKTVTQRKGYEVKQK